MSASARAVHQAFDATLSLIECECGTFHAAKCPARRAALFVQRTMMHPNRVEYFSRDEADPVDPNYQVFMSVGAAHKAFCSRVERLGMYQTIRCYGNGRLIATTEKDRSEVAV